MFQSIGGAEWFVIAIILILLFGGHKNSQQRNIDKAKEYWCDHLSLKGGRR